MSDGVEESDVPARVRDAAREWFDRPLEHKSRHAITPESAGRGYQPLGANVTRHERANFSVRCGADYHVPSAMPSDADVFIWWQQLKFWSNGQLLGYLLGQESKGSLTAELVKRGWATGLSAVRICLPSNQRGSLPRTPPQT